MKKIDFKRSIFLDSSSIEEIKKWNETGIIDGVTTNQMIMLKDGITPKQLIPTIKSISKIMKGKPVSIELSDSSATVEEMIKEAKKYREIGENIVVKVPLIPGDLKSLLVIKKLGDLKIPVNVTAMMTYEQLVVATLAIRNHPFPSFVSLFWARSIDDHIKYRTNKDFMKNHEIMGEPAEVNSHSSKITKAIMEFCEKGGYDNPRLIVGSIRNVAQIGDAFASGANIVTIQPATLMAKLFSQRTVETNAEFDKAWQELKSKK
jgi:transaldolase